MLDDFRQNHPNRFLASVVVITGLLSALIGSAVGVTYPSWVDKLTFLPESWRQASGLQKVTQGGKEVVRTVEESAVIDAVDKASPAVVSIVAKTVSFGPTGIVRDQQGIGTGFIVKSDGVILTNSHVVEDTSIAYNVVTADNKTYPVKKIDRDPSIDFAILKIDAKDLTTVELGDSDSIKVGQKVVAIGNALGKFGNTVTVGVVSGVGRGVTASSSFGLSEETLDNVIQTDAALNPGNSGGPLLDLSASVIGINFATTTGAENIGFVIPINRVKSLLDQYLSLGRIVRPYLGIEYRTIDAATASLQNVPEGTFVRGVASSSPAAKAGLAAGDIITKFGSIALKGENTLRSAISKYKVGDNVELQVWRDGKTLKLKATLAEFPGQ